MKLAVISDVHLEFGVPPPAPPRVDACIVAGDLHPDPEVRAAYLRTLPGEVLFVPGNHDFYGHDFPDPLEGCFVREIGGVRFAGATLWTGFPQEWWPDFKRGMADARRIRGISWERLQEAHEAQRAFLREARADVVITHHAPTWESFPERMLGSIHNPYYATAILDREDHPFAGVSLWIHGHIHTQRLFVRNGVHVLCHAHGYPMEERLRKAFRVLDLSRTDDGLLMRT